jgi:hypothetical protein
MEKERESVREEEFVVTLSSFTCIVHYRLFEESLDVLDVRVKNYWKKTTNRDRYIYVYFEIGLQTIPFFGNYERQIFRQSTTSGFLEISS